MSKIISIIGSPGSGKGTQIDMLAKKLSIIAIKTGEMVRRLAQTDEQTKQILMRGELAQNDKVDDMIAQAINGSLASDMIVLDAYPRDLKQAYWFDQFLAESGRMLDQVIFLKISDREATKRMLKRNRRYETENNIKQRLIDYNQKTKKVIDFYDKRGILTTVNGEGQIEDINQRILKVIKK
jgi:adenylate kinase